MRANVVSYPTMTANEVTATQTTTAANTALIINGSLSNIAYKNSRGYTPVAMFPDIQRTVQISSTGDVSTSTFTISGYDLRATGLLSTTIAGPTGSAVPTRTTTEFNQVVAIQVGTIATTPFTVGVGATGSSNWIHTDVFISPFNLTVAVVTGTSQPVTIQDTPNNPNTTANPAVFNHATLVAVTANQQSNYAFPVRYTRAAFVATTVGPATSSATTQAQVTFVQAGNGA